MNNKINLLRKEIDKIDQQLVELIAKRFKTTSKIISLKTTAGLPKTNIKREKQIFDNIVNLAKKKNINSQFICNLFKTIIKEGKK
ncbi:MAG: chorismate mutase [Candidatus Woesearchaeota archaeon]